MAYGTKYQLYCYGKDSVTSKTVIKEEDYAGAEIDRNVPANPFRLRKDAGPVIFGTSLDFLIREEVDFEFLELYTNNPHKYQVLYYYPEDTLKWTGWLNTQQYEVPYKKGPTNVTFQATDGLGLLKAESFTLTGSQTQLAIIMHCIDKIGLSLNYSIAVNIWEVNHDTDYCPLAQTNEDCAKFSEDNCYEVLEKILGKYDATITQWDNMWKITSYKDKKETRLIYTAAGSYSTTEAAKPVLDLGMPGESGIEVYPSGMLNLSLKPGGKKVRITSDYGLKESILDNHDFTEYASAMFTGWTKSGTFTVYQEKKDNLYYAFLSGYSNVDTDYIYQEKSVVRSTAQDFIFSFDVCPVGYWRYRSGASSISMEIRVQVTLVVGATTYYLSTDGWSTTAGYITQTLTAALVRKDITWTRISILTDPIPGDGTLTVKLMRFKAASSTYYYYIGVAFALPSPFFEQLGDFEEEFDDVANFDDSSEAGSLNDIEIVGADVPIYANASLMYNRVMRLSDGTPTAAWRFSASDTAYTLIDALVKMLASRNIRPRQMLRGTIKGTGITFESLIKHAYNSNREFEIIECTWDVYEAKYSVTLVEWIAFADQDVTYDSGRTLGDAADLTVDTVTPSSTSLSTDEVFTATVNIDNSGDSTGCQDVEWKITDGSDVTQSDGEELSGVVEALGSVDLVISMTAPSSAGTYYVKARVKGDSSWVSSAAITVADAAALTLNSIATISDGTEGNLITVSFNATNSGGAATVMIYWSIRNANGNEIIGGAEDITFSVGTDDYNITEAQYPEVIAEGYTLSIGLDPYTWDLTSNTFNAA